jgi:hypothetical protein
MVLLISYLNKTVLEKGVADNYNRIFNCVEEFVIPLPLGVQIRLSPSYNTDNIIIEITSDDGFSGHHYTEYVSTIRKDLPKKEMVSKILSLLEHIHYCEDCRSFKVFRSNYLLTDKCHDCYEASLLVIPGNCAICMEPISNGVPFVMQCSHVFHQKCMMKMPSNLAHRCPICRKDQEFYNWTEDFRIVKKSIEYQGG